MMLFGLTNALAAFIDQRNISTPLDQFVVVFINNVLLYSKSKEEYEKH